MKHISNQPRFCFKFSTPDSDIWDSQDLEDDTTRPVLFDNLEEMADNDKSVMRKFLPGNKRRNLNNLNK